MRKRYITIKAIDVQTGDRFTIGNITYTINLLASGIHPATKKPYNLIGAVPESNNKQDYITIELGEHATFTILK